VNVSRPLATAALVSSALMLLGACGGTVADSRPASAPPGRSAPAAPASAACTNGARSVCVTRAADGHTVTVGVGWTIDVDLHAPSTLWAGPSQSGPDLLHQIGAVHRTGGGVQVVYRALAPGRTELRASERPACPPAGMCPQFIVLWQLYVHVVGR
jgi:hypothetical protein